MGPGIPHPTFSVLGPLEVTEESGRRLTLGPKQRELLALLLLRRNRPATAEQLVEDLWGEAATPGAEVTLRSHLSHLRRRMSGTSLEGALTTGPAGYSLSVVGASVDVDDFEHRQGAAQEALGLGRPARAIDLVRDGLALWRGRPWSELDDVATAAADRARLEELRLVAWEVLAAAELELGRHRELVAELEVLVGEHPLREPFTLQLMTALYRSGRQADALTVYDATRRRLVDELGLDPGPALQRLHEAILRQDINLLGPQASLATPREPAPTLHDDGIQDAVLASIAREPIVGREPEQTLLGAWWDEVAAGGRRLVLVSGEAGMGKTRLVADLAARVATTPGTVLVGRCVDPDSALQPVGDAVRGIPRLPERLDELAAHSRDALQLLLGSHSDRHERGDDHPSAAPLHHAVVELLSAVARDGPALLVIDDAERLDPASAGTLVHLGRHLPPRTMVAVCYRSAPGERHPPLSELLGGPGLAPLTDRVVLDPLDESALSRLIEDRLPGASADLVSKVWRHTGGNPYFATEIARGLARRARDAEDGEGSLPLPEGLRDALRRRLAELSTSTRTVLATAGVLGREVDFEALTALVALSEDDLVVCLDEAVAAGFLVESGTAWVGAYAFPHEVMREASRLGVAAKDLRALHLQAARVLGARVDEAGRGAMAVARQLREAGSAADPEEVVTWCLRAADEAQRLYASTEAIEHADAALDVARARLPEARGAAVAVQAAEVRLRGSQGFPEAVALLETAIGQFIRAGDQVAAGSTHSRLGGALSFHHSTADVPRALDHFAAAERLCPEVAGQLRHQRGLAQAAMCAVATDVLHTSAAAARDIARGLGRRDLDVAPGWALSWAAFNRGRLREATELCEEAWRIAHDLADPFLVWQATQAPAVRANLYLLDPRSARTWCRRALGTPRFASLPYSHVTMADQLGIAHALQGDLDSAHEIVRDLPQDAVARRVIQVLEGRWRDAALEFARAAQADERRGDLHNAAHNHIWGGWARRLSGDLDGAIGCYETALSTAVAGPQVATEIAARAGLARVLAATDEVAAHEHVLRCDALMPPDEGWGGLPGQVEVARALVASARGDAGGADEACERAVTVFATLGLRWHHADALQTWAACLEVSGADAAGARRREAERAARSLGSVPHSYASDAAVDGVHAASTSLPQRAATVDP